MLSFAVMIITLLTLSATSFAQSIVVSGGHRSIVASGYVPPVIVVEVDPVVSVVPVIRIEPVVKTHRQFYLVSESWCSHCPARKRAFLAKGWPAKNVLTIAECQRRFGFRVPFVPYEFGEPVPRKEVIRTVVRRSHSDLVRLHNQLHGGGSWTWPGDLETHLRTVHRVKW